MQPKVAAQMFKNLVKEALGAKDERSWERFTRRYRAEMKRPEARRTLDLLAALSHTADFSVGCYCEDEGRCHRSVLRELLEERGASHRVRFAESNRRQTVRIETPSAGNQGSVATILRSQQVLQPFGDVLLVLALLVRLAGAQEG